MVGGGNEARFRGLKVTDVLNVGKSSCQGP